MAWGSKLCPVHAQPECCLQNGGLPSPDKAQGTIATEGNICRKPSYSYKKISGSNPTRSEIDDMCETFDIELLNYFCNCIDEVLTLSKNFNLGDKDDLTELIKEEHLSTIHALNEQIINNKRDFNYGNDNINSIPPKKMKVEEVQRDQAFDSKVSNKKLTAREKNNEASSKSRAREKLKKAEEREQLKILEAENKRLTEVFDKLDLKVAVALKELKMLFKVYNKN